MKNTTKYVMLSFDTEEFDIPREQGKTIPFEEKIRVSEEGTNIILDILKAENVRATFYCTTTLLLTAQQLGERIINEGHEMASHGCDHADPRPEHVVESKKILENKFGVQIHGYRQPRMFAVEDSVLKQEGYSYNSSINPAFIPGRYMHLSVSRVPFIKDGILQIPASVTPLFRFPLFWLSEHHLPMWIYEALVRRTLRHDGFFNTYFHPWEFISIYHNPDYGVPYIIGHNAGEMMRKRLQHLIQMLKAENVEFITYYEFTKMSIEK
jgi:peptidoglycan/xylan/chitin deacetylase (PgdA/CDA1 family)